MFTDQPQDHEESTSTPLNEDHDDDDDEVQFPGSRKTFPRVRTLLLPENEPFLQSLLEILDSSGCATTGVATNEEGNAWKTAFDTIYSTVATEYDVPSGKNRYHKFKDKIIDLWECMERYVEEGAKSMSHPLYQTASRLLDTYRTVGQVNKKQRGRPRKVLPGSNFQYLKSPPRVDATETVNNNNITKDAPPLLPATVHHGWVQTLEKTIQESFGRLELALLEREHATPKLPSPLWELHRLFVKADSQVERDTIHPYYMDALANHLASVSKQAANTTHPMLLPGILEGLDMLRRGPQDEATKTSIQYAYNQVLNRYLHLTIPQIHTRKRKADNRGEAHGGLDENVEV